MDSNEKIFDILYNKDDVTWQSILYELVKNEEMNPWDIDISLLANRYIETVKKMKELDLRISGKMILAAAILLKIKSNRLLNEDLMEFDRLLSEPEEEIDNDLGLIDEEPRYKHESHPLIPRTPQPRKRKVSIFDLVNALEKALEVKRRRVLNSMPPMSTGVPKKTLDIGKAIREVYTKIRLFFSKEQGTLTFNQLLPSPSKEDKIHTFIPLLHLTNQRKIDLEQEEHFGEITIMLASRKEAEKELETEN